MLLTALAPYLAFLALSLLRFAHFWKDPAGRSIGGVDTHLFAWYLGWISHCVSSGENPFYSAAMNAPNGFNVMWNTSVLAIGFVCIPFTHLFGALVVTNVLIALAPAISAWSAYWAVRRMTGNRPGALVAGLLFGFGPYQAGHSGHLHLAMLPLVPVIAVLLFEAVTGRTRSPVRAGLLLGVLIAVQVLISEEMLLLFAVTVLIAAALAAALNPALVRPRLPQVAVLSGVAVATATVLAGVPIGFQLFGSRPVTHGTIQPDVFGRADVAASVVPGPLQLLHTAGTAAANARFNPASAENTNYLGLPLVLLMVVLTVWSVVRRDRLAMCLAGTFVALLALTWGSPVGWDGRAVVSGPWRVFAALPVVGNALPIRFSGIMTLLIGLLVARYLSTVTAWDGRRRIAAAVAAAACLAPLIPAWPRIIANPRTPAYFAAGAPALSRGDNVLVLPFPSFTHTGGMLWQVRAGMKFNIYGGYSVFTTDSGAPTFTPNTPEFAFWLMSRYLGRPVTITAADYPRLQAEAARNKLSWVVVVDGRHSAATVRMTQAMLGCTPQHVQGVTLCKASGG